MTSLSPCRRCHRRLDCEIRARTLAALRGLGITKANLRCTLPEQDFPVGSRVYVRAFELIEGGHWDDGWRRNDVVRAGTVTGWRNKKATVCLDAGQEIAFPESQGRPPIYFLHAEPDRLAKADESATALCRCGVLPKARCEAGQFPTDRHNNRWGCQRENEEHWAREMAALAETE